MPLDEDGRAAADDAAAAAAAPQTTTPPPRRRRWRVRSATADADFGAAGAICGASFGNGALPGVAEANPWVGELEGRYASAIERDVAEKLRAAVAAKRAAALEARAERLEREAATLRARLRMAQGLPASLPTDTPASL